MEPETRSFFTGCLNGLLATIALIALLALLFWGGKAFAWLIIKIIL